jgi:hypothetical protein
VHPDALVVPGFVTVPAYPGAQIVQADIDVLPVANPVVDTPVGHEEQEVAPSEDMYLPAGQDEQNLTPAEEKLPAKQIIQPEALIVPGSLTVPAYPGAQIVQAETDVLPVAEPVVVTPVGQVEQEAAPEDEYRPTAHGVQDAKPVADDE